MYVLGFAVNVIFSFLSPGNVFHHEVGGYKWPAVGGLQMSYNYSHDICRLIVFVLYWFLPKDTWIMRSKVQD